MTLGAIDRRLAAGEWDRLYDGVYKLPAVAPTFHQRLMAAQLWLGPGGAASHRAAAALLNIGGVRPDVTELTTTQPGRRGIPPLVLHHTDRLPSCDIVRLGPLVVTNATRTLIDLGAVVDEMIVHGALDDALRKGLTSIGRLKWRLEGLGTKGRRGSRVIRALLTRPFLNTRLTSATFGLDWISLTGT